MAGEAGWLTQTVRLTIPAGLLKARLTFPFKSAPRILKANSGRWRNNDGFPKACGMWLQGESSPSLHDYLADTQQGRKKCAIPASGGQAPSPFGVISALPLLLCVEHQETRRSKEEAFTAS